MSNLTDRVSYIKGLAEGLKLDTETNEGKLIGKILELLSDLTAEVEALRSDYNDLDEYVEAIDSDLSDMEDLVYDEDGEDEDDGFDDEEDEEEDDGEDGNLVEYTCPHCGEEMTFEVDSFDFDEDYLCPNCHQPLFPETPDDEE